MWLLYGLNLGFIGADDLIQVLQISVIIRFGAVILRAVNIAGRVHDKVDVQTVTILMYSSVDLVIISAIFHRMLRNLLRFFW